jgi:hypothetical protein
MLTTNSTKARPMRWPATTSTGPCSRSVKDVIQGLPAEIAKLDPVANREVGAA